MDVDFVIPFSCDDLMNGEAGCYVVEEVYSANSLAKKLADSALDLRSDGPCAIIGNFDTYFSLMRHFNNVDNIHRDEAMQTLLRVLKQHTNNISPMVEPGADVDNDTRKQHLTALKMICYLVVQLGNLYEAEATKPTTQITATKGRGKSNAASKKKPSSTSFEWDTERDQVIELIGHMAQLDVNRLWNPPLVEEEFVNLITGFCYKLLENPTVTRNKNTKDLVFNLLGTVIKKYNTGLGTTLKIIQMIQHFEHLVPHLAQAVDLLATEFGVKSLVAEIIREIGMMNPADLAKDSSGTRAYADFLVDLTSRIPSLVLNNISLLVCHLDGESYSMRNGVLGAMGEMVQKVLSSGELDDNAKNLRDQFLDKLESHLHDTNAYVRSKVLQIWMQLCNNMAIPLPRQQHLLELVIGRLQDKSSIVRKYAVQLLKNFLVNNPFGANLPLDHLKEKLAAEMAKLKEMAPNLTQQSTDQVPVVACSEDNWNAMLPELQATIEEYLDQENNEPHNSDESDESNQQQSPDALKLALKGIKQLLNEGHHKKTLVALKKAQKLWPEETLLNAPPKDQENLFEGEENEASTPSKEQLVSDMMCILKTIFMSSEQSQETQEDEELDPEALLEVANQSLEHAEQENNDLVNDISKQQLVVQYLKDYVNFQSQMETAVPVICQLLASKSTTDVSEAIEFFVTSYEFGLRNAIVGVRRMLVLIWSRDNPVKESVVEAYKGLYLDPPAPNQRAKTGIIVKNLMTLTYGASIGDLTSLEELMCELMKANLIPGSVIKLLWEKFTMKVPQSTPGESHAALILLRMLASAEADIVRSNVDVLVKAGLGTRADEDFLLARDTCVALLKLIKSKKPGTTPEEPFRFPASHDIFERLTHLIVTGIRTTEDNYYSPMAEQAVNVIYALSEHPEIVCEKIIRKLVSGLIVRGDEQTPAEPSENQDTHPPGDDVISPDTIPKLMSCKSSILARFLVLCGHVALRQLIHLDVSIVKEIKRRQAVQENEKEEKRQDKETGRKKRNDTNVTANTTKDTTTNEAAEDEMGLTGATADDVEAEYIRKICEHDIVTGQNLLSLLRPLLVCVCSNPSKFSDPGLQAAVTLALAKFMLVSTEFCEAHLQLLFTVLEKSPHAIIRANTIIALGDLTFRFPNLLEPWTSHLYARLRDESPHVRKNTLMVLTHLILNDMVKVKGNISEMAICLEDKDHRISDLAKLFFLELSKKGNAVYNVLPDIISRLSDPDCGIEEEPFRNILKYMLSFIQKDRQSESLVEKLCHRFRATRCDRQWRDLAFCLSLLPFNERAIRKIQENFGCFHDKLSDEDVYQSFMNIIGKSRKFAKPEIKAVVDELEQRIDHCHNKGMEDEAGYERASKSSDAATKPKKSVSATPSGKSRKGVTSARRRNKSTKNDSDSEDEQFTRPTRTPRNPAPPRSARAKSSRKRKPIPSFESDDDDSIELFDLDEEDENDATVENDAENVDPNQESVKKKQSSNQTTKSMSGSRISKSRSIRT